jgi:hypothetical protein
MRGQSRKDARFREVIERKVPAKRRQANVIVAKDRDVRLGDRVEARQRASDVWRPSSGRARRAVPSSPFEAGRLSSMI